jgi:hypothetical protein
MAGKRALAWAIGIPFCAGAAVLVVGHAVTRTKRADAVEHARQHLPVAIASTTLPVNGVLLHEVAAGPATGPPVVLLHGHPDFWWGWHDQIVDLTAEGMRYIVDFVRSHRQWMNVERCEAAALDVCR